MQVTLKSVDDLIPYARNSRLHSPAQVAEIAASILEFGFTNPILADSRGIVAGHGRVMAVRKLIEQGAVLKLPSGVELPAGQVPVIDCEGWSEAQRKAYIIADNKIALNADWDIEMLSTEIAELRDQGFNIELTGWTDDELDELEATLHPEEERGMSSESVLDRMEVTIAEPRHECHHGDVWTLGDKHKLYVAKVVTEWNLWAHELAGDKTLFVPYPGIFAALAEKAKAHRLVMVQPDTYVAALILDRYTDANGEDSVRKRDA